MPAGNRQSAKALASLGLAAEDAGMGAVGAAAGGALAGIMIGRNIARLTAGIEAARASWKALEERGLELSQETVEGVLRRTSGATRPKLSGKIEGVSVTVRILSDLVHYAHTEIVAQAPEPRDVELGVHPSPWGLLGRVRSYVGQDIIVGDDAFDDAFLITGEPESAAPKLLNESIRQRITALNAASFAGLTFDGSRALILLVGVVTEPEIIDAAIDVVAELARSSKS